MNGFVALPPNTDAEEPAEPSAAPANVVNCDGWWPAIQISELREAVRIDTQIPPERLRDAVRQALMDMSRELAPWRADREAEGRASLADVPARRVIDGQSDYVLLWARGVYSVVAGDLGDRLRGQSATAAGHERADELQTEVDRHERNVRFAVRDFLGVARIRARMI